MINQLNELTKNAESHDEELFGVIGYDSMIFMYPFEQFSLSEFFT